MRNEAKIRSYICSRRAHVGYLVVRTFGGSVELVIVKVSAAPVDPSERKKKQRYAPQNILEVEFKGHSTYR